jgi:transposase
VTKSTRARYRLEFKLEAVRMVKGGQSLAVVSKVLDLSGQTLHNSVKAERNGQLAGPGSKPVSPEQMEIREGAGVKYAWSVIGWSGPCR